MWLAFTENLHQGQMAFPVLDKQVLTAYFYLNQQRIEHKGISGTLLSLSFQRKLVPEFTI